MKTTDIRYKFLLSSASILVGAMVVAGCDKPAHPDEKAAVNDSLKNNSLSAVDVSQDREKGVMTLKGNVDSQELKSQAENVAKQAAIRGLPTSIWLPDMGCPCGCAYDYAVD